MKKTGKVPHGKSGVRPCRGGCGAPVSGRFIYCPPCLKLSQQAALRRHREQAHHDAPKLAEGEHQSTSLDGMGAFAVRSEEHVGAIVGLTRQRVQQIVRLALQKIRDNPSMRGAWNEHKTGERSDLPQRPPAPRELEMDEQIREWLHRASVYRREGLIEEAEEMVAEVEILLGVIRRETAQMDALAIQKMAAGPTTRPTGHRRVAGEQEIPGEEGAPGQVWDEFWEEWRDDPARSAPAPKPTRRVRVPVVHFATPDFLGTIGGLNR